MCNRPVAEALVSMASAVVCTCACACICMYGFVCACMPCTHWVCVRAGVSVCVCMHVHVYACARVGAMCMHVHMYALPGRIQINYSYRSHETHASLRSKYMSHSSWESVQFYPPKLARLKITSPSLTSSRGGAFCKAMSKWSASSASSWANIQQVVCCDTELGHHPSKRISRCRTYRRLAL